MTTPLKCDFHIHTKEDQIDCYRITYSSYDLIDYAKEKKFDVLSITLHDSLFFEEKLKKYAEKKGILLIPGIEAKIEGIEFLILQKKPNRLVEKIRTIDELAKFKKKNEGSTAIILPHYFYGLNSIRTLINSKREQKIFELADAFEYSHFYLNWFNPNKKAIKMAKKYNKSIIGTSDMHNLWQMDHTYTLIPAKKNIDCIFEAIKKNNCTTITQPFFSKTFFYVLSPKNILKMVYLRISKKPL